MTDIKNELQTLSQMELEASTVQAEIQARIDALEADPLYVRFVELEQQITQKRKDLKKEAFDALEKSGEKKIETDSIRITLATRNNFKAEDIDKVPLDYVKFSLNTTRVGDYVKLYDKLPDGVTNTPTKYVIWKDKK